VAQCRQYFVGRRAFWQRGQSNYSTAKAGIEGLTKTLAKEWGRINVTSIAWPTDSSRPASLPRGRRVDHQHRRPPHQVGLNPELLAALERAFRWAAAVQPDEAAERSTFSVFRNRLCERADAVVQRRADGNLACCRNSTGING